MLIHYLTIKLMRVQVTKAESRHRTNKEATAGDPVGYIKVITGCEFKVVRQSQAIELCSEQELDETVRNYCGCGMEEISERCVKQF